MAIRLVRTTSKSRKEVMMGKRSFKGTRLTVDHILEEMGKLE